MTDPQVHGILDLDVATTPLEIESSGVRAMHR